MGMDWGKFYAGWRPNGDRALEPQPVVLPEEDAKETQPFAREVAFEGQSFMIEYVDTKNRESRRSISVLSVKYNDHGDPSLWAICHHRNAPRLFRIDRIQCCIDYDGEVHDPAPFLLETLDLDVTAKAPVADVDSSRLRAARDRARPHAILLAGLSRCDGYMHPDELGVLCRHCEQLSDNLSLEECDRLGRTYRRLKPTPRQMNEALDSLRSEPVDVLERFLISAHELIRADGKLTPQEAELYDQFHYELTGVHWL